MNEGAGRNGPNVSADHFNFLDDLLGSHMQTNQFPDSPLSRHLAPPPPQEVKVLNPTTLESSIAPSLPPLPPLNFVSTNSHLTRNSLEDLNPQNQHNLHNQNSNQTFPDMAAEPKKKRARIACVSCHNSKVACFREAPDQPCRRCKRIGHECMDYVHNAPNVLLPNKLKKRKTDSLMINQTPESDILPLIHRTETFLETFPYPVIRFVIQGSTVAINANRHLVSWLGLNNSDIQVSTIYEFQNALLRIFHNEDKVSQAFLLLQLFSSARTSFQSVTRCVHLVTSVESNFVHAGGITMVSNGCMIVNLSLIPLVCF